MKPMTMTLRATIAARIAALILSFLDTAAS